MTASRAAFEERLRQIGADRYHDKHPFHTLLHSGGCTPDQVRAWVINRFYYQASIPMKDAAFMSRVDDPALRRAWRSRIEDHDGTADNEGGIARWLRLADAVGLDRDYVASARGVLPATRFAVDAYVRFVRDKTLLEAVAASLTELFAPKIHAARIEGLLANYAFADDSSLSYFRNRLSEAPKDVAFGLAWVLDHADTAEKQDAAAAALEFKTDVLWAQLDALHAAYVTPARIPPGAWIPDTHLPGGRIVSDAVPLIPRGVRLHEDAVRGKTVLLAPERVIDLDPIGLAILQQIDGQRDMGQIIATLAALYDAPAEQIADDVTTYITGLMDRRILEMRA